MLIYTLFFAAMAISHYDSFISYYRMNGWDTPPGRDYVGAYIDDFYAKGCHSNLVIGNIAYVSGWASNGWTTLDITDPTDPERIGWVQDPIWYRATHLAIDTDRNLMYSVSERGDSFVVTDVSDPRNMAVLSSFYDATNFDLPVACAYTGNYALAIARGDGSRGILYIFDCSNEYEVAIAARLEDNTNLEDCRDIVISDDGNTAYIACQSEQVAIVDITTKTSPSVTTTIDLSGISCGAHSIQLLSSTSAVVVGDNTIAILNLSTNAITGSYTNATNLNNAYSVASYGDYAFVACRYGDGLTAIDISTPSSPSYVSKITNTDVFDGAYYVTLSSDGQYAYVSGYQSNSFVIVDVSDPSNMGDGFNAITPIRATSERVSGRREKRTRRGIVRKSGPSSSTATKSESRGPVEFEFAPYEYRELLAASIGSTPVEINTTTAADVSFSGSTLTSTATDFEDEGVISGQWIRVAGSGINANNIGTFEVSSVSSGTITVDGSFTAESGKTATITGYCARDSITEWPFYLERYYEASKYVNFDNMAVEELRLRVPQNGVIQGNIGFYGGDFEFATSSAGTMASWSDELPLIAADLAEFEIDGSVVAINSFDLSVRNSLKPVYTAYQRGCNKMQWQGRDVTGKLQIYFDDLTQAETFAEQDTSTLFARFSGEYDFVLYFPKVRLYASTMTGVQRGWNVTMDVDFEAVNIESESYLIQMDVV